MSKEDADGLPMSCKGKVTFCVVVGLVFALVLPLLILRPFTIYRYFGGWSPALAITLCVCSVIAIILATLCLRTVAKNKFPRLWYLPPLALFGMSFIWPALSVDRIVLWGLREQAELRNKTETSDGPSKDLQHTAIVLTIATPVPANKNVIWCSSFQIAWNEMKESVVQGPIRALGAEEIAERLNKAKASKADLKQEDYFAAADRVSNGIVKRIQDGMKEQFPDEPVPQFDPMPDNWAVAFAYLQAMIKFTHPFGKIEKIHFVDSKGNESVVTGFGCEHSDKSCEKARKQVEVLYYGQERDPDGYGWRQKEFALDLCKDSRPYQIVLASIEPKGTFEEMLSDLKQKIEQYSAPPGNDVIDWDASYRPSISFVEPVIVPEMFWRISHHFKELEGRTLVGIGPIVEASQIVHFRLDRFGAILKSEALFIAGGAGRSFVFDKPFLLYMKKRGGQQPFLVMWVDNAELLTTAETNN